MERYGSTESFKNTVKNIQRLANYRKSVEYLGQDEENNPMLNIITDNPIIKFTGFVKLHGCFHARSMVTMGDGTYKAIKRIKKGDFVMGKTADGETKPVKVINTFINGKTDVWYRIKYDVAKLGGNQIITCTSNHKIFTKNGYIEATNLKIGDELLYSIKDVSICPERKSILEGKLLGDGHISRNSGNYAIVYGHKEDHECYLDYCNELLGDVAKGVKRYRTSGYGTKMIDCRTKHLFSITNFTKNWLDLNGKKIIPKDLVFNKYNLAFWYMDDGSLGHSELQKDRALFATCSFTDEEHELLLTKLKDFGFENPIYYKDSEKRNRIRLNTKDAYLLFETIKDIVPDCMRYKLPKEFRNCEFSTIRFVNSTNQEEAFVKIINIEQVESTKYGREDDRKYDIETETHNYFVKNCLVHNSNGSFLRKNVFDNNGKVVETKQQFCSRERVLSFGHDNYNFWETYHDKDLDFLFSQFEFTNYCQIYGEVCGEGVQQNVAISELPRMFVIFAIKADGKWLNIDDYNLENEELRIFQINHPRFKRYEITIDFNNPNKYEEELEKIVEEIEAECPVGKAFGISGVGEGAVFINEDRSVFFKVKGEKHSGGNKKVRVSAGIERADLTQFLVLALPTSRLEQGIQYLKEMELPISKASTPQYLKWIVEDVFKEEMSVIEENGLLDKSKQIRQELSDIARRWFFKKLEK